MRMWTLDPRLLDRPGLVAAWRESLLAQAVLLGKTKGYTNHPQLIRFKRTSNPAAFVAAYLHGLADEADRRSYRFDRSRLAWDESEVESLTGADPIEVTTGQIVFEFEHLLRKLAVRSPEQVGPVQELYESMLARTDFPYESVIHPLFVSVRGEVEQWEKL